MTTRKEKPFSAQLEDWQKSPGDKTLAGLERVFAEKSFALSFLILLALPALPLPTGGVTHIFEIIAMLLALELIVGRTSPWLPRRWKQLKLGPTIINKTIPYLVRRIRLLERYSRPRLAGFLGHPLSGSIFGLLVFCLSLVAFLAPPFTGLDTLPSVGVMLLALGFILEDIFLAVIGLITGAAGVLLVIFLGSIALNFAQGFF